MFNLENQFRLLTFCAAAMAAHGQQQQQPPDCESMRGLQDPRCQYPQGLPSMGGREDSTFSRIPVIRDERQATYDAPRASGATTDRAPAAAPLPPEPPTEFQKFVEQASGAMLPVFGQKLFEQVPTTFAPADRIPVTPAYTLGPGDQLLLKAWGTIDLSVSPVVDRSGAIYVPRIGDISVAGIRFAQLQDYLRTAIGRVYRNFDLSVSMGQLHSIQVLVTGHARRPGAYTISALSTLVNAIFASGGPGSHGSMRDIRLMRAGREAARFDLYDLLLRGDTANDQPLLAGDVIYIPPAGPQIALTGSVNMPAIYELKDAGAMCDALDVAGGLTPVASARRALIQRIDGGSLRVIEASLEPGECGKVQLRSGDIVNVMSVTPRFEGTVTLRGNVDDPVRLPWRLGMRVRDLIPNREALLSREYWRTRNRLTPPPEEAEQSKGKAPAQRSAGTETGAATLRASATNGAPAAPGGAPTSIAAASTAAAPSPVLAPRNTIERNPLEVNWSYAVIERRNPEDLRTTLVPFNLGRAVIDGDPAENLPLEPGDIVTVFSMADLKGSQAQQTRYVRLEGEFASAGVYSVKPGETLKDLVKRAGGLTPQAYLFGSEFSRVSSRLEQQQRLDDLVDSLERQTASAAANVRGTVISAEEAASANSQIAAQRELVQKMRQVRAQGRIVLDLDPSVRGADALPALQLEDGDVFSVPSRPSFVNVVGSVYNGTSFLYQEDKHLEDYLRASGGPTRTADLRHAFLIRADGSVISKSWSTGLLGRFESLRLNPGDSIVVPEQINKTTFMKGLKDWSQIFAQFGLGAAAINILR